MTQLRRIYTVAIAAPFDGAEIHATMKEAEDLGLDYVVFNGHLIPVGDGIAAGDDYLSRFPVFTRPRRLEKEGF